MANKNLVPTLEYVLDDLMENEYTPKDLSNTCKEALDTFIQDYDPFPNMIKVDCKVDMAIPKESLQENLQLLIDIYGVQGISKLMEHIVESNELTDKNIIKLGSYILPI